MIRQRVQRSELGQSSAWISLCPVVLSPIWQEVGLASHDGQHRGIHQHLSPFSCKAIAHSPMLPFSKDGMSLPFLFKLCILSQGSGMPPSSPSYPDLAVHRSHWLLSLEYLAYFRQTLCYLSFPFSLPS